MLCQVMDVGGGSLLADVCGALHPLTLRRQQLTLSLT